MGTKTTATDQEGVALDEVIAAKRDEHEVTLRRSHAELTRQLAEIEALEHMRSIEREKAAAVAGAVPLMRRGRRLPRPGKGVGVGRPIESAHPFPNAVGNVRAWAAANGLSYALAKSWYSKKYPQPIHRRWAALLERTYGIPVTAWRGGVSDRPSPKDLK